MQELKLCTRSSVFCYGVYFYFQGRGLIMSRKITELSDSTDMFCLSCSCTFTVEGHIPNNVVSLHGI